MGQTAATLVLEKGTWGQGADPTRGLVSPAAPGSGPAAGRSLPASPGRPPGRPCSAAGRSPGLRGALCPWGRPHHCWLHPTFPLPEYEWETAGEGQGPSSGAGRAPTFPHPRHKEARFPGICLGCGAGEETRGPLCTASTSVKAGLCTGPAGLSSRAGARPLEFQQDCEVEATRVSTNYGPAARGPVSHYTQEATLPPLAWRKHEERTVKNFQNGVKSPNNQRTANGNWPS